MYESLSSFFFFFPRPFVLELFIYFFYVVFLFFFLVFFPFFFFSFSFLFFSFLFLLLPLLLASTNYIRGSSWPADGACSRTTRPWTRPCGSSSCSSSVRTTSGCPGYFNAILQPCGTSDERKMKEFTFAPNEWLDRRNIPIDRAGIISLCIIV